MQEPGRVRRRRGDGANFGVELRAALGRSARCFRKLLVARGQGDVNEFHFVRDPPNSRNVICICHVAEAGAVRNFSPRNAPPGT